MDRDSLTSALRAARERFWVRLWFWARSRAVARVSEGHPTEYRDARRAWRDARFEGTLGDPNAWNTRALANDLALHDAADHLLGKQSR